MLLLWGVMAAMAALAGFLIARPLLRPAEDQGADREAINLALYQEKQAELEAARHQSRIDQETFELLSQEADRVLLADTQQEAPLKTRASHAFWAASMVLFFIVPLVSLGYYSLQHTPQAVEHWLTLQTDVEAAMQQLQQDADAAAPANLSMADYLHVLQRKAQQNPDQPELWYQVGMGYLQANAAVLAEPALRRAARLSPENPAYQLSLAQVVIALNEGKLTAESDQLLQRVLSQHPRHIEALMLRAMGAFAAERYDMAIAIWQRMLAMGNGEGEGAAILQRYLALAKARQAELHSPPATETRGDSIRIRVMPSASVVAELGSGAFVLAFARGNDGNPAPVAAVRQPVTSWPMDIVLSDAQSMLAERRLSDVDTVDVVVRISASGTARAQKGDWQVQWSDVVPTEQGVALQAVDFQRVVLD